MKSNLINIISKIIHLNFSSKVIIMILSDIFMLNLSIFLSFSLRLGELHYPSNFNWIYIYLIPFCIVPIFYRYSIYQEVIRYFGLKYIFPIFKAVTIYALLWGVLVLMVGLDNFPRSVVIIHWILSFIFLISTRLIAKTLLNKIVDILARGEEDYNKKNIIIYGAGIAGVQIANSLLHNNEYKLEGYLDDDKRLHNKVINSVQVFNPNKLKELVKKKNIKQLIIAVPSISREKKKNIINLANNNDLITKIIPSINEIKSNSIDFEDLRNINVEDLLGRDQIDPDISLMNFNINKKSVIVTGAGGSIGSELCLQILTYNPKILILFEINEYSLFKLYNELKKFSNEIKIIPILGSVLNIAHLKKTINKFEVNTIYHTAAYKHVPIIEYNVIEGVYNNVVGTFNCIQASISEKIDTLVMISTDKAVRPTSVMGASKRFAEMLMQAIDIEKDINEIENNTKFVSVRFGNVLGSSGSVIPLFKEQIKNGGPISLTHKKIVRYFMTAREASQLVIQAGAMGNGGEIFLLDMGNPVKIIDLAKQMIELSGLSIRDDENKNGDIEINITGLRPGEKLYEELLIEGNSSKTVHPRIFIANEKTKNWKDMSYLTEDIKDARDNHDLIKIKETLQSAVPEFVADKDYDLISKI